MQANFEQGIVTCDGELQNLLGVPETLDTLACVFAALQRMELQIDAVAAARYGVAEAADLADRAGASPANLESQYRHLELLAGLYSFAENALSATEPCVWPDSARP